MNDDMMDMEQDMKQMEEQFQAEQEEFKQLEEQFKAEEQAFQQQMEQEQARWEAEQKAFEEQYKEEQFFNDVYVVDQRDFDDQQWYDMEDPFGVADVDVIQINQSPVISNISDVSKSEGLSVGSTIATVSASDPDGDTLTYTLDYDPTGKLSIDQNGVITLNEAFDDVTEDTDYQVLVKVADGNGGTYLSEFYLTVTADAEVGSSDPSTWVTTGDGSAGGYKQTIGYVGTNTSAVSTVITDLGHTAQDYVPGITNIDNLDVLWYLNPSNSGWSENVGAYQIYQTEIFDWVNAGGIFVVHDRYVTGANDFLLGESMTITREFSDPQNYEIIDESSSNLLKYGPGGILTDSVGNINTAPNANGEFSMDGGNYTSHGSADLSTFDLNNELALATKSDTDSVIDFVYGYGEGAVYYSTIPEDVWVNNAGGEAYGKNSVHYATSLIFDGYSQIDGTGSADKLHGTTDDDVFWSRDGADEIWSGNGSDTFLYTQTYQTDPGSSDTILDFDKSYDAIDISAITGGAGIETRLTNGTLFEIDSDKDGSYEMQWTLDGYTGTADEVTVIT